MSEIVGLSFERPYLMEGLNHMIAKSAILEKPCGILQILMKNCEFHEIHKILQKLRNLQNHKIPKIAQNPQNL